MISHKCVKLSNPTQVNLRKFSPSQNFPSYMLTVNFQATTKLLSVYIDSPEGFWGEISHKLNYIICCFLYLDSFN